MKQEIINNILEKIDEEYNRFIEELVNKSSSEILMRAYEKVIKEDIKLSINNGIDELSKEELLALNNKKNILENIYDRWISNDYSYMEYIDNTVDDYMVEIEEKYMNYKKDNSIRYNNSECDIER